MAVPEKFRLVGRTAVLGHGPKLARSGTWLRRTAAFALIRRRSVADRQILELLSSVTFCRTLQQLKRRRPCQPELFRNDVHSATDSSTLYSHLGMNGHHTTGAADSAAPRCPCQSAAGLRVWL